MKTESTNESTWKHSCPSLPGGFNALVAACNSTSHSSVQYSRRRLCLIVHANLSSCRPNGNRTNSLPFSRLSVSPRGYLRNYTCNLYQIFGSCCVRSCFHLPPAKAAVYYLGYNCFVSFIIVKFDQWPWPVKLDLASVKMYQHAKYLGQRSFKVTIQTDRHRGWWIALAGPPERGR